MSHVNHVAYEVERKRLGWEVEFWKALGFGRRTRPEPKPISVWLNGGNGFFVHLMPTSKQRYPHQWSHVAFVPRHGLAATLDALERLPFTINAEEAEPWWGARRVFVDTPSGYRVELLEYAPPATWPSAPETD
jgi:hypothetical protein